MSFLLEQDKKAGLLTCIFLIWSHDIYTKFNFEFPAVRVM